MKIIIRETECKIQKHLGHTQQVISRSQFKITWSLLKSIVIMMKIITIIIIIKASATISPTSPED